jgi:acetoin:2,6-dichlorophenolindophenol oxidoreductase subunit alpha
MSLSKKDLREMLYWIMMGRRLEERITTLFKEGRLRGHHHPGIGQEATNVGVCYGLKEQDYVLLTHRGKAPAMMKGVSLRDLMAGYYCKKEGLGGGRVPTGSHMYGDIAKHVVPMPGVIGSSMPVAVGIGLGMKLQHTGGAIATFFGDGGSNRGDFHESVNMAAALKLPVVFVLANNGYSISVSVTQATGQSTLSGRAAGYGIPGVTVDGNDVRKVYEEASKALERARAGKGPSLIECIVHRWTGHSISDSDAYRTDPQRKEGESRCPLKRLECDLLKEGIITDEEITKMEARVATELDDAVHYAEKECTEPDPADILRGVYG